MSLSPPTTRSSFPEFLPRSVGEGSAVAPLEAVQAEGQSLPATSTPPIVLRPVLGPQQESTIAVFATDPRRVGARVAG